MPVPARLLLSLSVELRSVRDTLKAGNRPKRMPVTQRDRQGEGEHAPVHADGGAVFADARQAGGTDGQQRAHADEIPGPAPARRPSSASITLSVSSWRMMRARFAPSAERMANSRLRPVARTSSRLATLAQAISSTRPTAPSRTSSELRASPTMESRSGSNAEAALRIGLRKLAHDTAARRASSAHWPAPA